MGLPSTDIILGEVEIAGEVYYCRPGASEISAVDVRRVTLAECIALVRELGNSGHERVIDILEARLKALD